MSDSPHAKGWAWTTLGELIGPDGLFCDGDWVESKDQDPEGDVRLVQLADIGDGIYRDRSSRFLTSAKAAELGCTYLKRGDVLIARMPDPLGRACVFPGDSKPAVTAVDVCIARPGPLGAVHRWLMNQLNTPQLRLEVSKLQSGSTRKRISRGNLATIGFPLPPLSEQHRIVAKIEELFSQLDAGVEELKKARAQLKRYRQSVLKAAFEGKLTEEWRRQRANSHKPIESAAELLERIRQDRKRLAISQGKKYKEPPTLDTSELPELPKSWTWTNVGSVTLSMKNGIYKPASFYRDSGIACLRMYNIADGVIVWKDIKRMVLTRQEVEEYGLSAGDILVNRVNSRELVGKAAPIVEGTEPCVFESKNIRLRLCRDAVHFRYVSYWFLLSAQRYFAGNAQQVVGMASISQPQIGQMPIPVPPVTEQLEIAAEIERCISVADAEETTIDAALKQASRLRQSILKRAFEGRLVPQDPTDEPAERLLERIRHARANSQAGRSQRAKSQTGNRQRGER